MFRYAKVLEKYNLSFTREFLYVLLNCIDPEIDKYEDLVLAYKNRVDFKELKEDYKKFYYEIQEYLNSMDLSKDIMFHHKIIMLVDFILENDLLEIQNELKMFISNFIDLIFVKYHLNITNFNTNEEIRKYLTEKIGDENIVNLLVLLLLADTTLSNKDIEDIPEEEFENIISSMILISIYICKGNK